MALYTIIHFKFYITFYEVFLFYSILFYSMLNALACLLTFILKLRMTKTIITIIEDSDFDYAVPWNFVLVCILGFSLNNSSIFLVRLA